MTLSLHVCYLYDFFVFVYLSFSCMEYVIFFISTFAFFAEISAKLHTWNYIQIHNYYCVIFCEHILLYKCAILS